MLAEAGEHLAGGDAGLADLELDAAEVLELCRSHGFEPRFAPPASDIVMATLLAATGLGVTLVPASMGNVQFPGIAYRLLKTRAFMGESYFLCKSVRAARKSRCKTST